MILILLLMLLAVGAFWLSVAALTTWAVQFTILSLTRHDARFLRWVVLAVPVLLLGFLGESLPYAAVFLAGAVLLGWGLAWAVYKFICGGDRHEKADPSL